MAPNRDGGPLTRRRKSGAAAAATSPASTPKRKHNPQSVISKEEIESRGSGTDEDRDTYDPTQLLRCEKRVFFTAVIFLTRFPCPRWCEADHHPAFLMRSLQWFPLLGLGIAAWLALWLEASCVLWTAGVAVPVATLAGVWLTGAFHEDGLADTFDAFGGGWGRIMKDTRVGTYALVGMILVLAMKMRSLEHMLLVDPSVHYVALPFTEWAVPLSSASVAMLVAHSVSRWTSLPLIYCCHYIEDDEDSKKAMYSWFAQSRRLLTWPRLLLGTASTILIPFWLLEDAHQAMVVLATTALVVVAAAYYGNFVLGGVVGDYLGATIMVTEVIIYLVLTADIDSAKQEWYPFAILAACAALPILNSRPIVDYSSKVPCPHTC